jgi:hypothetical protein
VIQYLVSSSLFGDTLARRCFTSVDAEALTPKQQHVLHSVLLSDTYEKALDDEAVLSLVRTGVLFREALNNGPGAPGGILYHDPVDQHQVSRLCFSTPMHERYFFAWVYPSRFPLDLKLGIDAWLMDVIPRFHGSQLEQSRQHSDDVNRTRRVLSMGVRLPATRQWQHPRDHHTDHC